MAKRNTAITKDKDGNWVNGNILSITLGSTAEDTHVYLGNKEIHGLSHCGIDYGASVDGENNLTPTITLTGIFNLKA